MPGPWQSRGRLPVLSTRIFDLSEERLVSPRTGEEHGFYVLDCVDWVNIVALTDDEQVVMVRQWRYGTREETLELPGGMVDRGEDPAEAARRELLEETGFRVERVQALGSIAPNPALQSNHTWSFLARGATEVGRPALDGGEDIEVVLVPYREIPARIARGEISHALVVVAFVQALGLRAPSEGPSSS